LERRRIDGEVIIEKAFGTYRVKRRITGNPLVSIIIPFKDKPELLKKCVDSILKKSTYKNLEIILINNRSLEKETFDLIELLQKKDNRVKLFEYDAPFNFSEINNYGISVAEGEYVLLLNSDTFVINNNWIEAMLEHSQRPEVGAVGAKLYYPNGTVQHAGIIIGIGGVAAESFKGISRMDGGYFNRARIIQNLSAVTGACLMVKKTLYKEIGGFNEEDLKIAFNDIDFCLRIREKGYLNVFTPYAELYHYESASRGYENTPEKKERFGREVRYIRERYVEILKNGDPYYNINLSLNSVFSLKKNKVLNEIFPNNKPQKVLDQIEIREDIAKRFIHGEGIEIGALNRHLPLPNGVNVRYLDKFSNEELKRIYSNLKNTVNVDIIDDGEKLNKIEDNSQDFIIANHFIEHCQNPILALENMMKKLKGGGILFLAIPDKRYTFDKERPITSYEHLLKDYNHGPEQSKIDHLKEWVKYVIKNDNEKKAIKNLLKSNYSIHFHVWTKKEMIDFILEMKNRFNFKLEHLSENGNEVIFVLRK